MDRFQKTAAWKNPEGTRREIPLKFKEVQALSTLNLEPGTVNSYQKGLRNFTASGKLLEWTVITISIGLKFLRHLKHLARLVCFFAAVLNSEQIGQRNRKYPSERLLGILSISPINFSIGMSFLMLLKSRDENCRLIFFSQK